MATLLTAILRLLLRNCTKTKKNFWTQTAFNWNLRLLLVANLAKYWHLRQKKSYNNVINTIYYRKPRAPKSAGPVAIATFATIVNPALVLCTRCMDAYFGQL